MNGIEHMLKYLGLTLMIRHLIGRRNLVPRAFCLAWGRGQEKGPGNEVELDGQSLRTYWHSYLYIWSINQYRTHSIKLRGVY